MQILLKNIRLSFLLLLSLGSSTVLAGYYPMYASWPQPDGAGSSITLTYSFSNLFDGGIVDESGSPLATELMNDAFTQALTDYTSFLPINFIEIADAGPLPETGQYDPAGLADIRIGYVPHIDDANAYAYFPIETETNGLAGDIVFNGDRFGLGWTPIWFYVVAQHELGHSLGMGHYLDEDPPASQSFSSEVLEESSYNGPIFPINEESIQALQAVYGAGVGSVTPLTAVPEPTTWAMIMLGLLTIVLRREKI